ncbi:hypothetical protein ACEQ8H_008489 [Pleosporales sp. CAS-2024a]
MASAIAPMSIDSVVVDHVRDMAPSPPATPPTEAILIERPKLKGRQRLLNGLQQMGSSTSLAGLSRSRSHSLRSGGKASMSCVSLASSGSPYPHTFGSSFGSELSNDYSTAPTSVANSPPGSPFWDERTRIRMRTPDIPSSVPLPSARPLSRNGIESESDYFSRPVKKQLRKRPNFNFWADMPTEIRMQILRYLEPKDIVRCSRVSRSWHHMCFDGQLWADLDTSAFYRDITANALVNIITSAGPFVKDLNLRGCVQLKEQWSKNGFIESCRNLENFSLEGCRIDRTSIHCFLLQNTRLVHVNLSGLASATNAAMKIIASNCPRVEVLNISWCHNIDNRGLKKVVEGCPKLRDLRAGEVRGWDDVDLMVQLFRRNTLQRLVLMNCDSLSDEALAALIQGVDQEVDVLTDRPIVPPRKLQHLDLTRCRSITDTGLKTLVHNVPHIEGLQVSKCGGLTDEALVALLPTLPVLTHLDIEELDGLTNEVLKTLAQSPCAPHLRHLCISYCENLGDAGMLPTLKACTKLNSLEMDNTRISDLVLTEAAASIRNRNRLGRGLAASERPEIGLRIVAYDCANVTWTGVREVLSRNAEITRPSQSSATKVATYPREIIQLRCFYNWQPTVEEHTKRVLRGDFSAAARLERKWADWMMLNEEAGVGGAGARRRRRRAREAQMMHADEEESGAGVTGGGFPSIFVDMSDSNTGTNQNLQAYRIASLPPDFYYIPNFITPAEEASILDKIPSQRWTQLTHRRLQAHPSTLTKNNALLASPLPDYLSKPMMDRFAHLGIFDATPHQQPNHVLINEYKAGEGIMPHEDGGAYAPVVATISLKSSLVLDVMSKPGSDGGVEEYELPSRILQEPRSLLITTGRAYEELMHGIAPVDMDENLDTSTVANWEHLADAQLVIDAGGKNQRGTRISLTYRDVLKVSSAVSKVLGGLGRQ